MSIENELPELADAPRPNDSGEEAQSTGPHSPGGTAPSAHASANPENAMVELLEAMKALRGEIAKLIIGRDDHIELMMAALLTDGHVLLEGVPGIAKTLTAKLLAQSLDVGFSRIQFTPDLMPSDIIGI